MARQLHRCLVAAAAAPLALLCATEAPAHPRHSPCWDCDDIPFQDYIPFQWDWDGGAPESAPPSSEVPYPQGFVLTVPVTPGSASAQPRDTLNRYVEVGAALGRCWSGLLEPADAHWQDLTLRVSFKRDGTVNGIPRIVHVSDPADPQADARGRASLLSALGHCTPLPLSPSLGRAIAGQIFAIRFVQQRNS